MDKRLKNAAIIVVLLVWAANFLAPIFTKTQPPPELNVAFMAIIGALVGVKSDPSNRDSDDDDDEEEEAKKKRASIRQAKDRKEADGLLKEKRAKEREARENKENQNESGD